MIDLNHTKQQMLWEIKASEKAFADCITDPADASFVSREQVCLIIRGKTAGDFLPALDSAFSQRYPHVSPEQLFHDLLYPLRKGLGNAYKWGNQKDPTKQITVETVVTNMGAVVAISDEGRGFDVDGIWGTFQCHGHYFTHGGAGFRQFQKARSLISYTNGGSTLLIRFLCVPEPGKSLAATEGTGFGMAGDEEFMKCLLAAKLPYFWKNKATLESCHIYVPDEQKEDHLEIKYALKYHPGKSRQIKTAIMTARLLPEFAARTDFFVAEQLYKLPFSKGKKCIHIPKPMMLLEQPPMVLSKFNPSVDLREHLKKVADFKEVAEIIKMVAVSLRTLHQSMITLGVSESVDDALEQYRAAEERIVTVLSQTSPQRVEKVQQFFSHLAKRAGTLHSCELVPIHRAFAWKCILYGDKRFYFYHFDQCRYSHPGFDVGGFLADLLRFYVLSKKKRNQDFYYAGRKVFLETYFAQHPRPWQADVPFFIACAMLLRLDRLLMHPEEEWESRVDAFLEQCEQTFDGS